jgi:Kef-type K+ transport system membrane component KefB
MIIESAMTPFLQLLLELSVIIVAAKAGGWISQRLRQPAVLGELLAGLMLGPSVINFMHLPPFTDRAVEETVLHLAELGVICLMFIAGLEIDLGDLLKAGRVSTLAGVIGVIVPLALGAVTAILFGCTSNAALFIGIILTATSVSISAQTLMELRVLRRREGLALLGAAVIDDVLVILILSLFTALATGAGSIGEIAGVLIKMIGYLAVAAALGTFVVPRLAHWVHGQPISEGLTAIVLVTAMAFAWAAEEMGGLAAITGAFIAGVGLSRSPLRDDIERGLRSITYGFLVPIFFVSIGLRADVRAIGLADVPFALVIVIVAILSKVVGCGLGAYWGGFSRREALRVGVGMISRGEVGLIVAAVGIQLRLITDSTFAIVVIVVLVTTLITPVLLRRAFREPSPSPVRPPTGAAA